MGDAAASPFQVESGRGTGVNLAKVSRDEQVQEKEGPSHRVRCGQMPTLS